METPWASKAGKKMPGHSGPVIKAWSRPLVEHVGEWLWNFHVFGLMKPLFGKWDLIYSPKVECTELSSLLWEVLPISKNGGSWLMATSGGAQSAPPGTSWPFLPTRQFFHGHPLNKVQTPTEHDVRGPLGLWLLTTFLP